MGNTWHALLMARLIYSITSRLPGLCFIIRRTRCGSSKSTQRETPARQAFLRLVSRGLIAAETAIAGVPVDSRSIMSEALGARIIQGVSESQHSICAADVECSL